MLFRGEGTDPDEKRAADVFSRSCEQGDQNACADLAYLLSTGRGVRRDPRRAFELLTRACDDARPALCLERALMQWSGRGTARNREVARKTITVNCAELDDMATVCKLMGNRRVCDAHEAVRGLGLCPKR